LRLRLRRGFLASIRAFPVPAVEKKAKHTAFVAIIVAAVLAAFAFG